MSHCRAGGNTFALQLGVPCEGEGEPPPSSSQLLPI